MYELSDITGSISDSEISRNNGDTSEAITRKEYYKNLIQKSNSIPIINIFKHYGLSLNEENKKIICPFPSHKGGRESSPSFYYYPQTNSFWCFGCKIGIKCCDFVANMDNISKTKAASKILELFQYNINDIQFIKYDNLIEKLDIMLKFSNSVRNFRLLHADQHSQEYIEYICSIYDAINLKHNLSNDALNSVIKQLNDKINTFHLSI